MRVLLYEYDLLETFRFDCEYKFDNEYDFSAFELVTFIAKSSAILVVNRRTATRFDTRERLRNPVTNLVVPKSRTRSPGLVQEVFT